MNKSEKAAIIEQVRAKAADASIVVVTDFKGMSVEELTALRVKIRQAGGEYYVVKNTLARIALSDTTHAVISENFKENCAIALGFSDPVAVAKVVSDFAKDSKLFAIRCGSLEGKALSQADVDALAKMPSKEQLIAQALGTMNQVPTGLVSLMANMVRPLLYALKDLESKKAA
ncbi:50S ribosomal protein L10 [Turicimonas muris]|uniref:50S ribosomal protein L10 n=1 Tax=Turicimonas muris TaxID=1796652 RepID=UPI000E866B23|nr:50S ribosomal protein L10 [Turicimonas muris]HBV42027.1 50S ribosomal protein L10 [Desulfovibrio sp.]